MCPLGIFIVVVLVLLLVCVVSFSTYSLAGTRSVWAVSGSTMVPMRITRELDFGEMQTIHVYKTKEEAVSHFQKRKKAYKSLTPE